MSDKKSIAYKFFRGKGYTHEQASGIVGNLIAESGLNSTIKGDPQVDGGSHGIAQWNRERLAKLKSMYGNKWKDFESQLDFVDWELNNTELAAGKAIKAAKTIEEATKQMMIKYERPKNQSQKAIDGRAKLARSVNSGYVPTKTIEMPDLKVKPAITSPSKGLSFTDYNLNFDLPNVTRIPSVADMTTEDILNEDTYIEDHTLDEDPEDAPLPQYEDTDSKHEEESNTASNEQDNTEDKISSVDNEQDYLLEDEYNNIMNSNKLMIDDIFSLSMDSDDEPVFFKEGGSLDYPSVKIKIGSKNFSIPTDNSRLTPTERGYLLKGGKVNPSSSIYKKSVNNAVDRLSKSLPVFKGDLDEILEGMSIQDRYEFMGQEQNKANILKRLSINKIKGKDFEKELIENLDETTKLKLQKQIAEDGIAISDNSESDILLYIKDKFKEEVNNEEDLIDIVDGYDESLVQEYMRFGGQFTGDIDNIEQDLGINTEELKLLKEMKGSNNVLTKHLEKTLPDEFKDLYNNASRYKYLKSRLKNSNKDISREGLITLLNSNMNTPITNLEKGFYG